MFVAQKLRKESIAEYLFIYVADRGYHPCLRMLAAGD